MHRIKRLPKILLGSILGMVLVAFAFSAFSPLSVLSLEGERYHLDIEKIERIVPLDSGEGFYIEERSGKTIMVPEGWGVFKRRAALQWKNPLKKAAAVDNQLVFQSTLALQSDGDQCDPKVDGYNVYHVQGFIYIDPTTFIVIDENRSFGECPCDDPVVKRGKKANCPHVHHRTKKKIIDRARSCGLGDWFPVRRCR